MIQYAAIVLAAGQGKRMKAGKNKQFILLGDKPLVVHTLSVFETDEWCSEIILVTNEKERESMEELLTRYPLQTPIQLVNGGQERQDSVYCGLQQITDHNKPVFIHDGARPFVEHIHLHKLAEAVQEHQAALLAVPVTDTIKQRDGGKLTTLARSKLWAAQTPQSFSYEVIYDAHRQAREIGFYGTDDASLVERTGRNVAIVEGSYDNMKLTTPEDMNKAVAHIDKKHNNLEEKQMFRIGQGFDVHQLVEGRKCIIGGVEIPHEKGLLGHSDADVLLHTIADACLGAIGEGDIGKHFPDTDEAYKNADSSELLKHVWNMVTERGYELGNIDCTVIAQAPKMAPYIEQIRGNIAALLNADSNCINVKATTTEKLGFPGRGEGVAAQAVVLLQNSHQ
ncbi:bifunctional 2-C-methyl-D-erythritol 4-phosphate cytidylyltransferase/2-C-methyl-D-erythritol 2,4-cyclodiphosphate synthase [Thalassobacillus pellis]|uniref:bifunctional 2-C-methyl-D-erythritol 4-phosphate cytidylyltransferase/2-C-methyl-D-erythritol 2,4-cyclodiphosphate synthase n=1 Tax=Thalassobacillus pellis TaxID=748008 RepID=UPI001960CA9E|nr:bifunctional 2-C-methyl-D-erythritol 4-phosphate cytidylyltransferase/2-C-methyl-D-erythritol 2,4-cyclodiphosphate synthase [Thalassobacillus pellis]MBM7555113.1 2-C-methyl-D-erythritol 4-phosphate cytidylyltransferase/2-C-methyl-D-erythritol 4-phosphate cytidylyltransferase/2-C-methyl-D-erythritol 2,4-cyclodiphosphate synthase [Thalassobacillus pellis]